MNPVVAIQARVGSERFPGKINRLVCGQLTMLETVYVRCKMAGMPVWVLMPDTDQAAMQSLAGQINIAFIDGPQDDLVGRYAAWFRDLKKPYTHVVRITADCPLVDPAWIVRCCRMAKDTDLHYVAVKIQDDGPGTMGLPDGFDVEVLSSQALAALPEIASGPDEREHLTSWVKANNTQGVLIPPREYEHVKLSVDTEEDLALVREVFAAVGIHASAAKVNFYLREKAQG